MNTQTGNGVVRMRARLAPSPTGHMHLGNAWAFLLAWLACRSADGQLVLRMEDLDPLRSTQAFADELLDDLRWLGLDWDEGPDMPQGLYGSYVQSKRHALYAAALTQLGARVYPCYCTRKEVREQLYALAGAPHVGDMGAPYAGTCRTLSVQQRAAKEAAGRHPCLRFAVEACGVVRFDDLIHGAQCFSLADCGGDFALRRSDGVYAYQLAVVVDDGLMGITHVVRGDDLLVSTPRQLVLFDALGFKRPVYAHIPLLCDATGERLAKRHQSLSVRALKAAGCPAPVIVGMLAKLARLIPEAVPCMPQDLLSAFSFVRLPTSPVIVPSTLCVQGKLYRFYTNDV